MSKELTSILEHLDDQKEAQKLTLGEVIESFEHRGFGPLVIVPALVALLPPISGLPGIPAVAGLTIVLIAGQMIFGRSHPWIPARLRELSLSQEKVDHMKEKGKPWAEKIDSFSYHRLDWLHNPVSIRCIAALMVLLGLSMFPLGLVPFAVAAPAGSVLLLALGLVARDGLFTLFGLLLSSSVIWLISANSDKLWPF
jgi:hypothetical protein